MQSFYRGAAGPAGRIGEALLRFALGRRVVAGRAAGDRHRPFGSEDRVLGAARLDPQEVAFHPVAFAVSPRRADEASLAELVATRAGCCRGR